MIGKIYFKIFSLFFIILMIYGIASPKNKQSYLPIIIDHKCTNLSSIPKKWINKAKKNLHIAYTHTSHGGQLLIGMTALARAKGRLYRWDKGDPEALDLKDNPLGWADLGHLGDITFVDTTRKILDKYPNTNVIIWSWCGGCSDNSIDGINSYLNAMDKLEKDFPGVKFIYMTGHLDGSGINGNLHKRNQQIRNFCISNKKILYDFADIESHDPDGRSFLDKGCNDNCDYDSNGDGSLDKNWAEEWVKIQPKSLLTKISKHNKCDQCSHSKRLNCVLKGIASWWLWAQLAGWQGD